MPRYRAKVDENQAEIVSDLRALGCSVQPLHAVGGGVPDLLVGFGGKNFLLEVKDGNKSPSRRKLTPDQIEWHECWRGSVYTVTCTDDAVRVMCIPVL